VQIDTVASAAWPDAPGICGGALYHVTARGNVRQDILLDDKARWRFLARIIHEGSWRNRQDAKRDGRAEPREATRPLACRCAACQLVAAACRRLQ